MVSERTPKSCNSPTNHSRKAIFIKKKKKKNTFPPPGARESNHAAEVALEASSSFYRRPDTAASSEEALSDCHKEPVASEVYLQTPSAGSQVPFNQPHPQALRKKTDWQNLRAPERAALSGASTPYRLSHRVTEVHHSKVPHLSLSKATKESPEAKHWRQMDRDRREEPTVMLLQF